jgi:hypothetical protein
MKNTDTLLENARALITSAKLDENIDHIKSLVSTVKVGDSTTFGKVLEIGANSITFKAKDLPKTTIAFNARKMGSSEYVLDKLLKLKEDANASIDTKVEASTDDNFYRLPGHVINNELFVAVRNLNTLQSSLRNGNDLDLKSLKSVIKNLIDIAKHAKSFKASDKIPLSYQYTVK